MNKKLTLKAEFSSLGINTVILFPATFSILLDEEKNVLHKCRDVEHILMTHIKAIRGHEDVNKRIRNCRVTQLEIHFPLTLSGLFSFCTFFSSLPASTPLLLVVFYVYYIFKSAV